MRCTGDSNLDQGAVTLWTKFDRPANYHPNSDGRLEQRMLFVGSDIGAVKSCSPLVITKYEWAGDDERFYVYVQTNIENSLYW